MQILSSLSGLQFSAASAGFAPTNSADVSAIASAYQVVSATATQLNAGTAYLTSVNETPISASRAGNAANASLATSAWYDGTGRLISALPDEATVSSIASAYAESAASSKLDNTASSNFYPSDNPSGFISGVDLTDYATTAYVDSSISSFVDSAYVESQVSAKQDTLTFDWDADSAISSINGSALAGQGGGASIPFIGNYWDSAESATANITADVLSVSSLAYTKYDGTTVNTYKGISDSIGIHHLGVASFIEAGAEINGTRNGTPYTLAFAPSVSMWTTSDAATGIFSPLQYGTGAGMFMDNSNFKGYLKGNEWFVSNTAYGYVRGEVHNSRGSRVIAEQTAGSWAALSAKNYDANVTLSNGSKYYGSAKMAVANSQAYVQVQRGNSDSKYNSAKLDTDYLKFYNGMTTGYLDPEDTASGTAYMPAQTEYMYISSIPYWNAKLDASAIECDTASAITAIGGSAIAGGGGGIDSATCSAIASAYAESAASSKLDTTAYNSGDFYTTANESSFIDSAYLDSALTDFGTIVNTNFYSTSNPSAFVTSGDLDSALTDFGTIVNTNFYSTSNPSSFVGSAYVDSAVSGKLDSSASSSFYTTANESGFLTGLPSDITARNLSAEGRVRATVTGQDLYGNFDYAGMYFRSGSTRPYNIGIDNTGTNFYIATAKNGFERIYASSIQSWNGKLDSSASSSFYSTSNPSSFVGSAYVDSAISSKMDSTAIQTAYASASATQATATGVLYILLPDGA